jgi:hypothetical protein
MIHTTTIDHLSRLAFNTMLNDSKENDMKWFVAKIIFKISGAGSNVAQFDEHLKLIAASNFDEAFLKARILGISEEETLLTDKETTVRWEFVNVAELVAIKDLKDGSEIYSCIHETDEGSNYIHHVHQRAVLMQTVARTS